MASKQIKNLNDPSDRLDFNKLCFLKLLFWNWKWGLTWNRTNMQNFQSPRFMAHVRLQMKTETLGYQLGSTEKQMHSRLLNKPKFYTVSSRIFAKAIYGYIAGLVVLWPCGSVPHGALGELEDRNGLVQNLNWKSKSRNTAKWSKVTIWKWSSHLFSQNQISLKPLSQALCTPHRRPPSS